jgi:hypothetical protein
LWNSSGWSALGSGTDGTVFTIALDGYGDLIVGGLILSAGGVDVEYIAKWNGECWSGLGSGVGSLELRSMIFNEDKLYTTGRFGFAGGKPSYHFAAWSDQSDQNPKIYLPLVLK